MIEILLTIILSILTTFCIFMIQHWVSLYQLKKLENSRYLFPIEILYNGITLKLDIKNDEFKHEIDMYCHCDRITYYCNGKIVGYMLVIEYHGFAHRFLYMNNKYDTSDFWKIMKVARQTYRKNQNQEWDARPKKETIFK